MVGSGLGEEHTQEGAQDTLRQCRYSVIGCGHHRELDHIMVHGALHWVVSDIPRYL